MVHHIAYDNVTKVVKNSKYLGKSFHLHFSTNSKSNYNSFADRIGYAIMKTSLVSPLII